MRRLPRVRDVLAVLALTPTAPCLAQTPADPPVRRVEVHAGGGVFGQTGLGSANADLLANDPTRRPFRLFQAESRLAAAPTFHARAGFALSRRFGIEGGLVLSRPEVRTSLSGDVEGAPALTVVERIDQYLIEAGVIVLIEELRAGGAVPFVSAGAGYLRQLHEGRMVAEQGHVYHAGGGIKHSLMSRDRGLVRAAGLRGDVRLYLLAAGVSFSGLSPQAAVSGSAFVTF